MSACMLQSCDAAGATAACPSLHEESVLKYCLKLHAAILHTPDATNRIPATASRIFVTGNILHSHAPCDILGKREGLAPFPRSHLIDWISSAAPVRNAPNPFSTFASASSISAWALFFFPRLCSLSHREIRLPLPAPTLLLRRSSPAHANSIIPPVLRAQRMYVAALLAPCSPGSRNFFVVAVQNWSMLFFAVFFPGR